MRINVERNRRGRVPHHGRDGPDVDACPEEPRRDRVPHRVHARDREAGLARNGPNRVPERVRVRRPAPLPGKHVPEVWVAAERGSVARLLLTLGLKGRDRDVRERERADPALLRALKPFFPRHDRDRAPDRRDPPVEIDVLPAERRELAATEAGREPDDDQRPVAGCARGRD